jgi:hypothetical protein
MKDVEGGSECDVADQAVVGGMARPAVPSTAAVLIQESHQAGTSAGGFPTNGGAMVGWFASGSNEDETKAEDMVVAAFCARP